MSEEEPGRILHETRMSADATLFEGHRTRYYGSTDATPLFVVAAAELVAHRPPAAGRSRTSCRPSTVLSRWIDKFGDLDGDGFVESVRRSDGGLVNQGWKDSWNAIVRRRRLVGRAAGGARRGAGLRLRGAAGPRGYLARVLWASPAERRGTRARGGCGPRSTARSGCRT